MHKLLGKSASISRAATSINRSNILGNRIIHAFSGYDPDFDLATGKPWLKSGTSTQYYHKSGGTVSFSSGASRYNPTTLHLAAEWTIAVVMYPVSYPDSNAALVGMTNDIQGLTYDRVIKLVPGYALAGMLYDGATKTAPSTSLVAADIQEICVAVCKNGTLYFYRQKQGNNIEKSSVSCSNSGYAGYSTPYFAVNGINANASTTQNIVNLAVASVKGWSEIESLSFIENPWQVFLANKSVFLPSASAGGVISLAGSSTAVASASGVLAQTLDLTSGAVAAVSATGVLNQSIGLTGSAASVAVANGIATISVTLSGTGLAQVAGSGSMQQITQISGDAAASAAAQASIAGGVDLTGIGSAQAIGSGNIQQTTQLSGAAAASAASQAGLAGGVDLTGSSVGQSTGQGALNSVTSLTGPANSASTAAGTVNMVLAISGQSVAQALGSGSLNVAGSGLSGDAFASANTTGDLLSSIPVSGLAPVTVTGSGGLEVTVPLTGAAITIANGDGDITLGFGGLSAQALAVAAAGGSLILNISMSAHSLAQATAQAALTVPGSYSIPAGTPRLLSKTPARRILRRSPAYVTRSVSRATH